eukprot:TRINITY_DN1404_c0_g1_i2.p1 TRINITY_DN1404_c0_g1~~TRINITY_DN1404_c0_g1_i2.p1  ORF type:complete len:1691 (-),score=267.59 TRINITY_DN1404_c0_g1_i2:133-5205(-)
MARVTVVLFLVALVFAAGREPLHPRVIHFSSGPVDTLQRPSRKEMLPQEATSDQANTLLHYVLHFDPRVDRSATATVAEEIASFFGTTGEYVPSNTHIVFTTEDKVLRFSQQSRRLVWWDKLHPAQKRSHTLLPALKVRALEEEERNPTAGLMAHITVPRGGTSALANRLAKEWQEQLNTRFGDGVVSVKFATVSRLSVRFPLSDALLTSVTDFLTAQPEVYFVSNQPRLTFFNDLESVVTQGGYTPGDSQTTVTSTGTRPLWLQGINGTDEIVSVSDTGIDYYSCYFRDAVEKIAIYPLTSGAHRKIYSLLPYSTYDCTSQGTSRGDALDQSDVANGHGTHVAGSIAGVPYCNKTAGTCSTSEQGMAPGARLFFQDIAPAASSPTDEPSPEPPCDLYRTLFNYSLSIGSYIHSNSWGAPPPDNVYNYMASDVDMFMWVNPEFLLLYAAGNQGSQGNNTVAEPGVAKNVLTVGASKQAEDQVAVFSSYGPVIDGRIKPDIVAPGWEVWSVKSQGTNSSLDGCALRQSSGTSMATPITAGSAALIREYLRRGFWYDGKTENSQYAIPKPDGTLIKGLLIISASGLLNGIAGAVDSRTTTPTFPNNRQGYGRINLANIVPGFVKDSRRVWFNRHKTGVQELTNSLLYSYWCVQVRASAKPFKVLLTWPELPASRLSNVQLINNLDLMVYSDTVTFKGNWNTTWDTINTVELVAIDNPPAGRYLIQVSVGQDELKFSVPSDYPEYTATPTSQPFTLIILGDFDGPDENTASSSYCPVDTSGNLLCPGTGSIRCTGVGACQGGVCQCTSAYRGPDCSVPQWADSEVSAQCNLHGKLIDGLCVCYGDLVRGFYVGDACETCGTHSSGKMYLRNTAGLCIIDPTCSGHGEPATSGVGCNCYTYGGNKSDGTAHNDGSWGGSSCSVCATGWYGPTCKCRSANCDGHGQCTSSGCKCQTSFTTGYWQGDNTPYCNTCTADYERPSTGCKCKKTSNTTECSGHGTCTTSGCVCIDDNTKNSTGHWKPNKASVPEDCAACQDGWGPANSCKSYLAECNTDKHGTPGANGCTCDADKNKGYWRTDNPTPWSDGSGGTIGTNCLLCQSGFYGPNELTNTSCLCRKTSAGMCGGHGTCSASGCVCNDDDLLGHWAYGTGSADLLACSRCGTDSATGKQYYGPDSSLTTSCLCLSADCNGHGRCTKSGCNCSYTADTGFWGSAAANRDCSVCAAGAAPVGSCKCQKDTCDGHGTCTYGVGCVCKNTTLEGFWMSKVDRLKYEAGDPTYLTSPSYTDCAACRYGFSGTDCTCAADTCKYLVVSPGMSCTSNCKASFSDGTVFEYRFDAGVISSTVNGTLRFYYVSKDLPNHPSKASPAGYQYLPLSSFQIEIGNLTNNGTAATMTLTKYIEILLPYDPKPSFTDVTVNYDKDPPTLMYLSSTQWLEAGASCGSTYRLSSSQVLDKTNTVARGRVCFVAGRTQFAYFAKTQKKDNSRWFLIGGIIGIVLALILGLVVALWLRRKLARERKEKKAKQTVIDYITKRKEQEGKSLRNRLGLRVGENFTPEMAAHRILKKTQKTRKLLNRYLQGSGREPSAHSSGVEASPSEGTAAVGQLLSANKKPFPKVWEFKEHETEFLEACRKVRGMFAQDPFSSEFHLRANALPELQQGLVELQTENEKLKRLLVSIKRVKDDKNGAKPSPSAK